MVKKMKSTADKATSSAKSTAKSSAKDIAGKAAALLDSQLASSVKDSAQHIWLAGMGAFSRAQEEGTKVFDALIKEGMSLQKKTQGMAEEKISEVTGKMSAMAGTVSAKAGQNWDKLEGIFEQRTAKAMNKLGVPTAKDVEALTQRVDALAAAVAKLNKSGTVKAAPKAASKAAVKPVAKKAAPTPFSKAPVKRARKTVAV
jgi:poly(hydroxyalkanoate) granule-associated protein